MFLSRFALHSRASKSDILQLFLNYVYIGNFQDKEIRGFYQALKMCFDSSFEQLSYDEYISLVAMLIDPNEFNVLSNSHNNRDRVQRIKKLLASECTPINWRDNRLCGCSEYTH